MGINKLIQRLGDTLAPESRTKKKYKKRLKKLLGDLRDKEKQLQKKLNKSSDERKRDRLQKELNIVHTEREVALEALSEAMRGKAEKQQD